MGDVADRGHARAVGGEQDRREPPGKPVVEVVAQPSLVDRQQVAVPPRRLGQDLTQPKRRNGRGMARGFVNRMTSGLSDEHGPPPEANGEVGRAPEKWVWPSGVG